MPAVWSELIVTRETTEDGADVTLMLIERVKQGIYYMRLNYGAEEDTAWEREEKVFFL